MTTTAIDTLAVLNNIGRPLSIREIARQVEFTYDQIAAACDELVARGLVAETFSYNTLAYSAR